MIEIDIGLVKSVEAATAVQSCSVHFTAGGPRFFQIRMEDGIIPKFHLITASVPCIKLIQKLT